MAFCAHAILQPEALVVPDALEDPRFADNPLVTDDPRVRFYAGYPLSAPDGSRVGTFCILDHRPRALGEADLAALRDLARLVEEELVAGSPGEPKEVIHER
jgi:GAF domain-containing protein